MTFDGDTYDEELDGQRLGTQLYHVRKLMSDARWRTLPEICAKIGCTQTSASARLRDLRKSKFGSWEVDRRRRKGQEKSGVWEYRLTGRQGIPLLNGQRVGLSASSVEHLRLLYTQAGSADRRAIERVIELAKL